MHKFLQIVRAPLLAATGILLMAMTEPETGFVPVGDDQIHFKRYAPLEQNETAKPLVMIHGASGNLHDLDIALLPEIASGREVILFDRPGLGQSTRSSRAHDPRIQAALLSTATQKLGISDPIIFGHSYGGAVALAYGLQFPEAISGLVLAAPVSHPWSGNPEWYNSLATTPVTGHLFRYLIVPVIGPSMAKAQLGSDLPDNYYENGRVGLLFRPRTFGANARDLVNLKAAVREMQPHYTGLDVPVIILAADLDTSVSTQVHSEKLVNELPQAELRILPGAGHMLPHTRTGDILKAVDDIEAK